MLDNEPDQNDQNSDQTPDQTASESPPAAAPRRRRAATRAAGPPQAQSPQPTSPQPDATQPDAIAQPTSDPDQPAGTEPADGERPRRRRRAGDEPAKRAPRRRKSAEAVPAPAVDEPTVEAPLASDDEQPAPLVSDQVVTADLDDQPVADVPPAEDADSQDEAQAADHAGDADRDADSDTDDADADESAEVPGDSEAEDPDDQDDAADSGDSTRRRRRRRGGRRRRRGSDGEDSAPEQQSDSAGATVSADAGPDAEPQAKAEQASSEDAEDDTDESGNRRRRRRRRRRGEDAGSAPDDPTEVVVRVREPRARKQAASSEVTGISGSTRMEAKRLRRREGREAGRRRAPILSEAEFLARRESVARKMIIRQLEDPSTGSGGALSQIAVLEDDILVEHYVDRDSAASLIGNVYLGRVQNVLPSMEAAFVDIGRGRNAVIYAGEVDWDAYGAEGQQRKVENVLKSGQTILVQVTKDPVGAKGARLTGHVSIPGRYIVYAPGGHLSGISRKLPENERRRLKDVLADLVPETASVIVRTAAEGASEDELVRDVNRLKAQWEDIERKVKAGQAPQLLYGEPDLTVRIVRDLFTEDFSELIIQGNGGQVDAYDAVEAYVSHVAPHLHDRIRRWDVDAEGDLFATFRLDEQIAKGLERKVFLPSGGSLVIDRTEAMTVIDVNTGRFTGSGGNLEATVTSNNLEAAEEIVRQLRLRDLGGIIVIDFIDMVLPSNRELLLRRLVECLGRDRTRHQVAEVTSLGLVQMTRKRIGTGLLEAFSTECEHCHGRGYEIHDMPVATQKQADGGARDRGPRTRAKPEPTGRRRGRGRASEPADDTADHDHDHHHGQEHDHDHDHGHDHDHARDHEEPTAATTDPPTEAVPADETTDEPAEVPTVDEPGTPDPTAAEPHAEEPEPAPAEHLHDEAPASAS